MKQFLLFFVLPAIFIQNLYAQSGLVINEIMASNINFIFDESREYDDWIEIYNPTANALDIAGKFFSDDPSDLLKFQIPTGSPQTVIPADSFLIIWADDAPQQGVLHLNFKLSSDGEVIILTDKDQTTIIDQIIFPHQTGNYSFGRSASDLDSLKYFMKPTPNMPNTTGYHGIVQQPVISVPSGNYPGTISVNLIKTDANSDLYYTMDGSDPDTTSNPYPGNLLIDHSTVLTVRAFRENYIPSIPVSRTFFINQEFNLPVFSIITDPANLFSDSIGIYTNYLSEGANWERQVYSSFIRTDSADFTIRSGIRIQGRTSRSLAKKSFRLFFKSAYGFDQLNSNVFNIPGMYRYQNLVLRSGYDDDLSPTNSYGTLLRDPIVSEAWKKTGHLTSEGLFCSLYLNNDYWGIYNLRESVNEYFIGDHLGYTDFDLIRYEKSGALLKWGTRDEWDNLWQFISQSDFSDDAVFEQLTGRIDIENFTELQALVQCTQYRSWSWGVYTYRENSPGALWRWTIWDMDRALEYSTWNIFNEYYDNASHFWANLMVRKLLENENYKVKFINTVSDYLNSYFTPANLIGLIDSMALIIEAEIPAEVDRWNSSVTKWNSNIERLRVFANDRPAAVKQQMVEYFSLNGPVTLTLPENIVNGKIRVNSIGVSEFPWQGSYFPGVPIQITAVPDAGYEFAGWNDDSLPQDISITLDLQNNQTLYPLFVKKFESNYFEIISPSKIPVNTKLPVITRLKNPAGSIVIKSESNLQLIENPDTHTSTQKLKKGTGTFLISPTGPVSEFSIEGPVSESETKIVETSSAFPPIFHSGTISSDNKIWTSDSVHVVNADMTISATSTLHIEAGTVILLKEHVNIFNNGTLKITGTQENPVLFINADSNRSWGGIEFINSVSDLSYCFFINGGGDPTKGWAHTNTQPVLFAKSNSALNLDNIYIMYSPGKALGGISSKITVNNSVIAHMFHGGEFSYSRLHISDSYIMDIPNDDGLSITSDDDNDGFHFDHIYTAEPGYSTIDNCFFIDGKDDAIDHNTTNLLIKNSWLENWLHEGVAASGSDTVMVFNTIAQNCANGFEAGWGSPYFIIDHSLAINNGVGLRFGDSYNTPNTGHLKVTNSIFFNNTDNVRNFTKHLQGPLEGAIDVTYSITNDAEYDSLPGNINALPLLDEKYQLLPESPGASMGNDGSNMGLIDELSPTSSIIVINEIMYKAADNMDSKDWIELYNPSENTKNISNWMITDSTGLNIFTIPPGTFISGKEYVILCEDTVSFKEIYQSNVVTLGNFEFGLNRNSDQIRLFAANGYLVDSVAYTSDFPWPETANGNGPSIELINPTYNNNIPQNWKSSSLAGGSPGMQNSVISQTENVNKKTPLTFTLHQNYPNPFNPSTTIAFEIAEQAEISLRVFNIAGQLIKKVLTTKIYKPGLHEVLLDFSGYSSGIYIYELNVADTNGNHSRSKKMLLLK